MKRGFRPTKTKGDKGEIRQETQLTRPPRMEGKVTEAMMQPMRKRKKGKAAKLRRRKPRGFTKVEEKNYQLRSRKH